MWTNTSTSRPAFSGALADCLILATGPSHVAYTSTPGSVTQRSFCLTSGREKPRRRPSLLSLLLCLLPCEGSLQQQGLLLLGTHAGGWKLARKLPRKLPGQV